MQPLFLLTQYDMIIISLSKSGHKCMKRTLTFIITLIFMLCLPGCSSKQDTASIVATTKPVYDFTEYLCNGTGLTVSRLVTENVSCLHDYTLQVRQMRAIEAAQAVIISGAGLEDFLQEALIGTDHTIDASKDIETHCGAHSHTHTEEHHHDTDPHIWLSVKNARQMAQNICTGLIKQFPQHRSTFENNLKSLQTEFDELEAYGKQQLSTLSTRDMITFHDGFSYFAEDWDLNILRALEEESGSEASAAELKELITLVDEHKLPAIFVEENGSVAAANVIAAETNAEIFVLNMGMSDQNYFDVMYQNINAVKEALG